jgi:hypothetical protein
MREEIGPAWLKWLGITIEGPEESQMCDEKMAVVGRAAGRRAQRQHDARVAADAVRAFQSGAPAKKEHGPAYVTLCVVGGIVLLAELHAILHVLSVLLIIAAVIGTVAGLALVTRSWHLPRRRRYVVPAPDPELAARTVTTVESATVLPLDRARRRADIAVPSRSDVSTFSRVHASPHVVTRQRARRGDGPR